MQFKSQNCGKRPGGVKIKLARPLSLDFEFPITFGARWRGAKIKIGSNLKIDIYICDFRASFLIFPPFHFYSIFAKCREGETGN